MKNKLKILLNFLRKYLIKDTKYCLLYLYRLLIKDKKIKAEFYNTEEIIKLIDAGKSIIRIGDGEIGLLHYLPIHYQIWSKEIRKDFLKLIKNYNNNSNYILAIPTFVNYTNKELDAIKHPFVEETGRSKKFVWLPLKISFEMFFNKKVKYMDQHLFYRFEECNKVVKHILNIKKIFIFISEQNSIQEIKKDNILNQKIKYFIETPNINAFEYREKIIKELEKIFIENNLNKNNSIVIFKGGLAKTIIFELSKNYQILDVGKGFISYTKKENLEWLI